MSRRLGEVCVRCACVVCVWCGGVRVWGKGVGGVMSPPGRRKELSRRLGEVCVCGCVCVRRGVLFVLGVMWVRVYGVGVVWVWCQCRCSVV